MKISGPFIEEIFESVAHRHRKDRVGLNFGEVIKEVEYEEELCASVLGSGMSDTSDLVSVVYEE
jgi:hypothetical protein